VLSCHNLDCERALPAPKLTASSLDLRPLYYFVQVAESGSFSRASASLSVGQPVLSRFIKRLEDDLQVQLLHRNGRGVHLTRAGERLFEHAGTILHGLSQAQTDVIAMRAVPVGNVSIALPPLLGGVMSAELVRRLRAEYPLITVGLREGFAVESLDWLASGLIDIAILFNPPPVTTLVSERVLDDQVHLVGAPGALDLTPGKPFAAKGLADVPLVLPPKPHRLRGLIDEAGLKTGTALKVEVEITGTNTMLELVRRGIGCTALPSVLLADEIREGRLQSWPIVKPTIPTKLCVATSMQRPHSIATKIAVKTIKDLFSQYRKGTPR
jgi:LysR family transcriptional regulator, nitrogen assimilation regulatory protein